MHVFARIAPDVMIYMTKIRFINLILILILAGTTASCVPIEELTNNRLQQPMSTRQIESQETAAIDAAGLDFAERRVIDVYERVAPSVVNITTQILSRDFFFRAYTQEGAGSGFILDYEGHILTNYHVIEKDERLLRSSRQMQLSTGGIPVAHCWIAVAES